MRAISMAGRSLYTMAATVGLIIVIGYTVAQGTTARPAKDVAEQSKAVTTAAQYLQGHGFTDPMVAALNVAIDC